MCRGRRGGEVKPKKVDLKNGLDCRKKVIGREWHKTGPIPGLTRRSSKVKAHCVWNEVKAYAGKLTCSSSKDPQQLSMHIAQSELDMCRRQLMELVFYTLTSSSLGLALCQDTAQTAPRSAVTTRLCMPAYITESRLEVIRS